MRTFATLAAVSILAFQLPAQGAAQVVPQINAPGQNRLAPPPNTMLTLLVPIQLQDLHTTITRAAVVCELRSYDTNGNVFSLDAQGTSDTLAVPLDGNLSQDVVIYMESILSGTGDGRRTQYECELWIGQATGDLVQPSLGEARSGMAFRGRSDRAFTPEIQADIP